jgi:hypothetical protein
VLHYRFQQVQRELLLKNVLIQLGFGQLFELGERFHVVLDEDHRGVAELCDVWEQFQQGNFLEFADQIGQNFIKADGYRNLAE